MCDCHCYNIPQNGGCHPEVMLKAPSWSGKETICIDACIADAIQMLWDNEIETLGCCCGHNIQHPSVVIADSMDAKKVLNLLLEKDGRDWDVFQWKLIGYKQEN